MKKIMIVNLSLLMLTASYKIRAQANTALSNLTTPVAINSSLLSDTDNGRNLGMSTHGWRSCYVDGTFFYKASDFKCSTFTLGNFSWNLSGCPSIMGTGNFYLGMEAGNNSTFATGNTVLGLNSGSAIIDASLNTIVGNNAGNALTDGHSNTFLGNQSGKVATSASSNVFAGHFAGAAATTLTNSVYLGIEAGHNSQSGKNNIAIGYQAANVLTTGSGNVFLGMHTGKDCNGSGNICIGIAAGTSLTAGNDNVLIGSGANTSGLDNLGNPIGASIANSTAIGNGVSLKLSNTMVFGSDVIRWGFGNNLSAVASTKALVVGTGASNGNAAFVTNGGVFTNASSRYLKDDFIKMEPSSTLISIRNLPITKWKYTGTGEFHIGPMAEDFWTSFQTGVDNHSISTLDPSGIALSGIQALTIDQQEEQNIIDKLTIENEELLERVESISSCISQLCMDSNLFECDDQNRKLISNSEFINGDYKASILSASGQPMPLNWIPGEPQVVDLSQFPTGSYTLLIFQNGVISRIQNFQLL